MGEQSADENLHTIGDESVSGFEIVTNLVADMSVPGMPGPVRRNFLKAVEQLCSAAIEVPASYLAGKADERRAETAARIKLLEVSSAQIAKQMQTDPEYAHVAVRKFGQRILREQVNLDMITHRAANELQDVGDSINESNSEQPSDTINDDWLNTFETEARQKSTEEMHILFGKILAGEIRQPGSYSTRTVKILGSLDQNIADHFVRLCSMCISSQSQEFILVPSMGGNAGDNALRAYGLSFRTLNLLNEHGLIISEYNSWWEHTPCLPVLSSKQQALCKPFGYQAKHWILVPMSDNNISKTLRIYGIALTQSGRELFTLVKVEPMEDYSRDLARFLEGQGFRMVKANGGQPRVVDLSQGI